MFIDHLSIYLRENLFVTIMIIFYLEHFSDEFAVTLNFCTFYWRDNSSLKQFQSQLKHDFWSFLWFKCTKIDIFYLDRTRRLCNVDAITFWSFWMAKRIFFFFEMKAPKPFEPQRFRNCFQFLLSQYSYPETHSQRFNINALLIYLLPSIFLCRTQELYII